MLALMVTALIGAAIASLLSAVAYGTRSSNDLRAMVVRHKTLSARLAAAIRGSQTVLACGSDHLVLWTFDDSGEGLPNFAELRRIELESDGRVVCYRAEFPANYTQQEIDAVNPGYQLTEDFDALTRDLKDNPLFVRTVWAHNVSAWELDINTAAAQDAALVQYRITLRSEALSDTAIGAAALRSR